MDARTVLAARQRARQKKVELDDKKSVTITRPPEGDIPTLMTGEGDQRTFSIELEHVRKYVTGWEGFTEADLLGEGVGASDLVPFDPKLWDDVVGDNVLWINKIGSAILEQIVEHFSKKDIVAKNSEPA